MYVCTTGFRPKNGTQDASELLKDDISHIDATIIEHAGRLLGLKRTDMSVLFHYNLIHTFFLLRLVTASRLAPYHRFCEAILTPTLCTSPQ